ncbi:GRAM domain-containing protein 4 [Parasteatoda tepidariorum]|uniref:GRAM domain-containing protein 4 n=1 Tax=Parasteatoda tepidariorum TaxID=114398 RepID=UPI00077FA962|nr:GRAM domain-containing protein 4 [Parasteatoda tepidariorum]
MSLRQAIKSKFRSEKPDIDIMPTPTILHTYPSEERLLEEMPDECPHPDKLPNQESCSACYESQLAQLQEQFVQIMLENQQLVNEIKDLKSQNVAEQLMKQLEKERERYRVLSEKLHDKETKETSSLSSKSPRLRRFARKEKHTPEKSKLPDIGEGSGTTVTPEKEEAADVVKETEEGEIVTELTPVQGEAVPFPSVERPRGLYGRFRAWVTSQFSELVEDFSEPVVDDDDSAEDDSEGDPLTVRKLKDNLVRFTNATKPVSSLADSFVSLLRWNSPGTTLLAFFVYMYTVYHGWLLSLILFLFISQLTLNYIKGWFLSPNVSRKQDHEEGDLGVSDKFQLVLQVARKVQNKLGYMADCLEKIKNLMLWQQMEVTAHLYFVFILGFIASCIFSAHQLFTIMGFYMGVKFFIIDYIFFRFPRVQQKHDTTARLWKTLPTDAQLERKHNRAELDKLVVNQSICIGTSLSSENQNFCELFNLPTTETPLPAWHGGRRCTLINKDKSLTAAFKNGRLYLTNSFLCFERSKSITPKNLVLALRNISKVEKAKPYPWIPGGGMAIEITMISPEKTYIFGAILNRDETLESIIDAGSKAGLAWASASAITSMQSEHEEAQPTTSTKKTT